MKLKLKNFQSWKDQEFKFLPFTVVVGETNSGKSAIVRALEALLYNVPNDNYLRRGADKLYISFNDTKHEIIYEKKTSPKYYLDGEAFSPGRGSSEQIGEIGYAEIDAEKSKIRPQYKSKCGKCHL